MSILLSPVLNEQQFDANGDPLAGGFIYTYLAGTTTPVTTYKTSTGTAHSNPIVLDSAGYYPNGTQLWLDSSKTYKFEVQNSLGALIRTYDNISPINDVGASESEWINYTLSAITYISGTSFSIAGDQTSIFQIGRRVRTTNTGGTIYSTITNSVFGATTTVTLSNDSGVLDSGLSAVYYGIISPINGSLGNVTATGTRGAFSITQSGTGAALNITNSGTGDSVVIDTSALVIDTLGQVIQNHTVAVTIPGSFQADTPRYQSHTNSADVQSGFAAFSWNSSGQARIAIARSDSNTVGTHSALNNGTTIGDLSSYGDDATSFIESVRIRTIVDGAVSSGIVPGAITVSTANSSGTLTECLRISATQAVFFSGATNTTQITTGAADAKYVAYTTGMLNSSRASTASSVHQNFYNPNGLVGSISTSGTTTAYNTTSDETLKDFIGEYSSDKAIQIIKADPVREFTWKQDGSYAVGWGAQTSYKVSPDLATPGGWFDENGNEVKEGTEGAEYHRWGVDQSKRTPYLWAAVSHLIDKVEQLEQRIADLENQ